MYTCMHAHIIIMLSSIYPLFILMYIIVACIHTPTYVCPLNCIVCVSVCSCVPITLCIRQWSGVLQEFLWPDGQHASEWEVLGYKVNWTVYIRTYVWYAYPAKQTWGEMHKVCMMLRYNDRHMNKLPVSGFIGVWCTVHSTSFNSSFSLSLS